MHSRLIAATVLLTLASAAWGQAAPADSADSDTAMERAKRAAAGPMKAIQQASKIRRRPGESDAPAPPAAPSAPAAGSSTALAASTASTAVAPAAAAPLPVRERAEAPSVERVLEAAVRVPAVGAVAPLAYRASAAAVATLPVVVVAPPLLDALLLQPKMLSMVEPNIPARLMDQGPRVAEVEAELSLRADGSVAEVTLLPPVPRAWQRYISTALEQWRFEPMAGPRQHRVRLVFGSEN